MRFALIFSATVMLSGCSTVGQSYASIKNRMFPGEALTYSSDQQKTVARDLVSSFSNNIKRDEELALVENKSSGWEPAVEALQLRGYSVVSVSTQSKLANNQTPLIYMLDKVKGMDMAMGEISMSDEFKASRLYEDTDGRLYPASPLTVKTKGNEDE